MATPARAEAAAILPVFLINSRREVWIFEVWFIGDILATFQSGCQFRKFVNEGYDSLACLTRCNTRFRSCVGSPIWVLVRPKTRRLGTDWIPNCRTTGVPQFTMSILISTTSGS